jgi:secretion/DNA translocation related CpaE-like protein
MLTEQILRLCAAAGASPEVVSSPDLARGGWRRAAGILVGSDAVEVVARAGLPRRDGVLLVSSQPVSAMVWPHALALHAESVLVLPEHASDLVGRLADLVEGGQAQCLTVGVIGARGGVGASTLAVALALAAARLGTPAMLLDADPSSGGLDLVVGCEELPGLRWSEVAATSGRVGSAALRNALPSLDGLPVLSWGRSGPAVLDAVTTRSIVTAAQRGSRLVVIDLPRRFDESAAEAAASCDVAVVVCPADVGGVAAGARLIPPLRAVVSDLRVVVRRRRRCAVAAESVGEALQLPLLGSIPTKASVARLAEAGLGVPNRGPFVRAATQVLRELDAAEKPQ